MSTIVTRSGKGSALTNTELDANFTNLNTDKLQRSDDAPQTLTDGTTISWDVVAYDHAEVVLGGNRALANPSNPRKGQTIALAIAQDGSGNRTLTYGSAYDFGSAGTPTLSTGAGKVDVLVCYCYDSTTPKYRCALNKAS